MLCFFSSILSFSFSLVTISSGLAFSLYAVSEHKARAACRATRRVIVAVGHDVDENELYRLRLYSYDDDAHDVVIRFVVLYLFPTVLFYCIYDIYVQTFCSSLSC